FPHDHVDVERDARVRRGGTIVKRWPGFVIIAERLLRPDPAAREAYCVLEGIDRVDVVHDPVRRIPAVEFVVDAFDMQIRLYHRWVDMLPVQLEDGCAIDGPQLLVI